MDAALVIKYLSKQENKPLIKEDKIEKFDKNTDGVSILGMIISIAIGGYSAYLSYECNTRHNMSEPMKIIFAILAYIFGLLYLIYYVLFRSDYCSVE
jgi:hypothetical protein